jgi:GDPmannose 4,6-dehydratase
MWLMLQHHKPDDFVISTGQQLSVREFINKSFKIIGVEIEYRGENLEEVGYVTSNSGEYKKIKVGDKVITINKFYFRPTEVDALIGDYSKAKNDLGWKPKISLEDLIGDMMNADLLEVKKIMSNA